MTETSGLAASNRAQPFTSSSARSFVVMAFRETVAYSTVTDFARLRGWSASLPMITAA